MIFRFFFSRMLFRPKNALRYIWFSVNVKLKIGRVRRLELVYIYQCNFENVKNIGVLVIFFIIAFVHVIEIWNGFFIGVIGIKSKLMEIVK